MAGGETRIQLCGQIVIKLAGRRLEQELPSLRGLILFAYLTLNRHRTLARSELVDAVWGQRPPAGPLP